MRHWIRYLIGMVICLGLTAAAAPAQSAAPTATPPAVPAATQTLAAKAVSLCPPGVQETCDWFGSLVSVYGPWILGLAVLALIGWWLAQRFLKVAETKTEEGLQGALDEIKNHHDLDESSRLYLEYMRATYRYFKFRGLPRVRAKGIEPPQLDQAYISLRMTYAVERQGEETMPDKKGASDSRSDRPGRSAGPIGETGDHWLGRFGQKHLAAVGGAGLRARSIGWRASHRRAARLRCCPQSWQTHPACAGAVARF